MHHYFHRPEILCGTPTHLCLHACAWLPLFSSRVLTPSPHMPQNIPAKVLTVTAFLLFLSPSIQPALINPNEVPWHTIPAFALAAFAAYLISTFSRIRIYKIIIPLSLGIVPILLHALETSLIRSLFYISFSMALLGLWILATNASAKTSQKLLFTYTAAAFIWCLLAILAWSGLTHGEMIQINGWALTTDISSKINGPFANGNVFGILVFCAWVISLWYWLKQKKQFGHFLFPTTIFFWAVGIASLSRGAWAAHAIVVFIVLLHLLLKNRSRLIPFIIAFALALPLGLILNSQGGTQPIEPKQQFEATQKEGFGARLLLWASVFEVWNQHPWQGVGYGQLGAHYLTGQHAALKKRRFTQHGLTTTTYAHNAPLHLLAESGIGGALLALFISLTVALALMLNWNRMHSVAWPATMIASMLWLQGMANISMTRPFPILLFCLAMGIALRVFLRYRNNSYSMPRKYFTIPVALSILILCSGAYAQTRAWDAYGEWLTTKNGNKGDRDLVAQLLSNDSTMPYVVGETVRQALLIPSRHHMAPQFMPYITAALEKLETPLLYQGLFFTQALSGEMNSACETGRFIAVQNWDNHNQSFYQAACEGKLLQTLEIKK